MDQLPKILQNMPKVAEQLNIPAEVRRTLAASTENFESVKQTIAKQKAHVESLLEREKEYESKMQFYEKLKNTAEDIGEPDRPQ